MDPEVSGDLLEGHPLRAPPGDAHHIVTELLRVRLGHVDILSGHPPGQASSDVPTPRGSPVCAEREGISATALQNLGVPDETLKQAGFEINAASSAARSSAGRRTGGTRALRIPIEDVEAAAKKLGSGWKLADLAEAIDRDPTTTRNYLKKLLETGTIKEIGDDPKHDGRAPKLYGAG